MPDVFVFVTALTCYLILRKLRARSHTGSQETHLMSNAGSEGGVTETFIAPDIDDGELDYFTRLNKECYTEYTLYKIIILLNNKTI